MSFNTFDYNGFTSVHNQFAGAARATVTGQTGIRGSLPLGTNYDVTTLQLGSASNRFSNLYARTVTCGPGTFTTASMTKGADGPFTLVSSAITPDPLMRDRLLYSTRGSVASVNNTAVTFSTNATGECGLFAVYTLPYTASCIGQYMMTATPLTYISTGSPALQVTVSGSNLQVKFASATTAQTVYWKKLKLN